MSDYLLRTLFVHTPGTCLILESDAVKAIRDDMEPRRLPLRAIDTIVVTGGVDVSTPLLLRCAEDGRLVAFLSRFGKPRAVVEGAIDGRGTVRRHQYIVHLDPTQRLKFAESIVAGKIDQMSWGLRQWARDFDSGPAEALRQLAKAVELDRSALSTTSSREQLLGAEGVATRRYFSGLGTALRGRPWSGRGRRPPTDPVNATLSFLYGMARVAARGGLHVAGLDPSCGFLHGDASGQPSLVLDLLEEFRPAVDRLVVTLFNKNRLRDVHFEWDALGACSLSQDGRKIVMDAWHAHRVSAVKVIGSVAPIPRAALPVVQAYAMANALRHGDVYSPHRLPVT